MALSNTYKQDAIWEIPRTDLAPLRFYAELYVKRSPDAVWSYFSNLGQWRRWSPICRGCRLDDSGGTLRLGSVLEISFAVLGVVVTVRSRVVEFDPPCIIAWHGQRWGIHATHRYCFLPQNEGTLLCNEETFTGVRFPVNRLMRTWYGASKLSEGSLHGLRNELARNW